MEQLPQQNDFSVRIERVMNEIEGSLERKGDRNAALTLMKETSKYAQLMSAKYPDYFRVVGYHLLIGSTPPSGDIPGTKAVTKQDFPGEDSVLVFLDNLRKRLLEHD